MGGIIQVHRVGTAGENDADGVHGLQLGQGGRVRLYLAIHIAFTDPAGDELVILSAEVQNDDSLMGHGNILPCFIKWNNLQRFNRPRLAFYLQRRYDKRRTQGKEVMP